MTHIAIKTRIILMPHLCLNVLMLIQQTKFVFELFDIHGFCKANYRIYCKMTPCLLVFKFSYQTNHLPFDCYASTYHILHEWRQVRPHMLCSHSKAQNRAHHFPTDITNSPTDIYRCPKGITFTFSPSTLRYSYFNTTCKTSQMINAPAIAPPTILIIACCPSKNAIFLLEFGNESSM